MLQVRCPGCSTILSLADSRAGGTGCCPDCGQGFRVPVPEPRPASSAGNQGTSAPAPPRRPGSYRGRPGLGDSGGYSADLRLPSPSGSQAATPAAAGRIDSSTPGKLSGRRRRRRRRAESTYTWREIGIAGACILAGGGVIFWVLSYLFGGAGVLLIIFGAIVWLIGMLSASALHAEDDGLPWWIPFAWTLTIATKLAENPLEVCLSILLRLVGIGMILLGIWLQSSGGSPEGNPSPQPDAVQPAGRGRFR